MTGDEIRAFIDRYVRAWEQGDIAALVDCFSEDCDVHSPIFQTLHGRASVEASFRDLYRAFADWKVSVDDVLVDDGATDRALFLFTASITHRGDFLGVTGTGRRVQNSGAFKLEFENGRIRSEWRVYDFTGFLVQLGVLKARPV